MTDPAADYIISRYQAEGPISTSMAALYAIIAPVALDVVSKATEIPIPVGTFTNERVTLSGKVDYLYQAWHPVRTITAASLFGTRPLRVGTEIQVANNQADVAIGEDGETISLSWWLTRGDMQGSPVFVSYTAGMNFPTNTPAATDMPKDLVEVFAQQALLIGKETNRVGQKSQHLGEASTDFTRGLPEWAQRTLNSYRRIQAYV